MGEAEDVDADHMTWTWNPAQPIFRLQAWLGKNQKELDLKLCCNDLLIHLDWTLDIITLILWIGIIDNDVIQVCDQSDRDCWDMLVL